MKRRELIKPDLNTPNTRMCYADIEPTTKLFGDDLSKHLKDMAEARKVGRQMQKPVSSSVSERTFNRGYKPKFQGRAISVVRRFGGEPQLMSNGNRCPMNLFCPIKTV